MKIRATQALMECLLEQEVDTVFGYPGGTILNVYDELYHYILNYLHRHAHNEVVATALHNCRITLRVHRLTFYAYGFLILLVGYLF